MRLTTDRLLLIALDQMQLELMVDNRAHLELALGLKVTDDMDEPFPGFYQRILNAVSREPAEYPWVTDWQVVLKDENRIIGGFTFKRAPTHDGFVELGYGLNERFWGKGYMTEAISAAVAWAKAEPTLKTIVAKTDKNNQASMRVLEKAGFSPYSADNENYLWKLIVRP